MSLTLIPREQDIVTGSELEFLFELPNFPAFMGTTNQPPEADIVAPMVWHISRESGMIQLDPVLPLEVVYQTEHNPGTTGASWLNHHQSFAQLIAKYNPTCVYEIGAAHGILNVQYNKLFSPIEWHILDPNPIPDPASTAVFNKGFFTKETVIPAQVDMVVHSHVLEHFYNPIEFFENLQQLKPGTRMCFSVPSLKKHLSQPHKFTNVLNFEHTYFCTEDIIEYWLDKYGFKVLEQVYYDNDHSIFYATEYTAELTNKPVPNQYAANFELAADYYLYHIELIRKLNDVIRLTDRPVYLFGAHVFSQFLIAFGLKQSRIKCILDNSAHKQNQRLYGTNLSVKSPDILAGVDRPIIILRSGVFDAEIKAGILAKNPTAEFIS